jgi:hypothetical protein
MGGILPGLGQVVCAAAREFGRDAHFFEAILFVVDTELLLHCSGGFNEPMADSNYGN